MKFAAVITLALLVVSCHHEKAASAETATAPDPCALISTDDLRRITGFAAKEGETTGDEKSAHRCTWHEGGEAGAGVITITIHVENLDRLMGQLRNIPMSEPLSGLGDEAYWNNALNQLTMRSGARVITISFNSSGGATDHRNAAIEIAKLILPKLT